MLAALFSLALSASPGAAPDDGLPDTVLVVVLDDVGKDLLAVYGGPEPAHTPNLDLLAAGGRVYDRAYAYPLCAPSRACLVTGRYGFRNGYGRNPSQRDMHALAAADVCLPELLTKHGDVSVQLFNKWHLVVSARVPATDRHAVEACSFERFFGHVSNLGAEPTTSGTDHYRWRRVEATPTTTDVVVVDGYATDDFSPATWATSVCKDALVAELNQLDPARPAVFVWAPVAPHGPFQAPPVTLVSAATAATVAPPPAHAPPGGERPYALAMLEALDAVLGELLAELVPERRERLTVLVVGDNGTARGAAHPSLDASRVKGSLYERGIGVPLIVHGPRVAEPGTRDGSLVHVVDLVATIAELVGAPVPLPEAEDSVSFVPTFADGLPGLRRTAFAERFEPNGTGPVVAAQALVGARFKLIRRLTPAGLVDELYDLELDPGEVDDLLSGTPTAAQLEAYAGLRATLVELAGPASVTFCSASDGSLAACPCLNEGDPQAGCDLAQGTGGVELQVQAQTTEPANFATLVGRGYPPVGTPTVVLRSSELDPAAPVVFGDGLRCIGLPLVRLGATVSVGGVSTHAIDQSGAPKGTSFYQLYFRDVPGSFCRPDAAFNLSTGRALYW